MGDIVQVEDLWKKYGSTEILRGVTLEVEHGEVKVVMDSSSTGKLTLLRCTSLLATPDRGRIILEGRRHTLSPRKVLVVSGRE